MGSNSRKFIVYGTGKRISPKGHFLVQLRSKDIDECNLKSNSDVIITHDTGKFEIVKKKNINKKKKIKIKVRARLHEYSEEIEEEEEEKEIKKGERVIRLDQTIRAAIGVNKKEDDSKHHKVLIEKAPKNRKKPFSERFLGFGRQRSIARVFMATFTDMEVDICRIRETTMECIGIDNGDKIVIESTTKRIIIRALNLSEQMAGVREKAQEKDDGGFYSLRKNLRLLVIKKVNKHDDLPWILIDYDARNELEVKLGDPVVIYRDNWYAISKNIQSLTVPLVVMLVSIVEGSIVLVADSASMIAMMGSNYMLVMRGLLYLLGSIVIIWLNLLPVKNKFK